MKKKILYVVLFLLIASGITIFLVSEKGSKEDEPEYLPCPVLEDGETVDIIFPAFTHAGWSASRTARFEKREGRCVDAWVNEDGMLVERYDRETLEQEYERLYGILMANIDASNTSDSSNIKKKVTYDYSEIYMYVSDDADLNDFLSTVLQAPTVCKHLRLLLGLSVDEATAIDLIYI